MKDIEFEGKKLNELDKLIKDRSCRLSAGGDGEPPADGDFPEDAQEDMVASHREVEQRAPRRAADPGIEVNQLRASVNPQE